MQLELPLSERSSSKNCHSWICPEPEVEGDKSLSRWLGSLLLTMQKQWGKEGKPLTRTGQTTARRTKHLIWIWDWEKEEDEGKLEKVQTCLMCVCKYKCMCLVQLGLPQANHTEDDHWPLRVKWAKQTKGGRVGKHPQRLPLTVSTGAFSASTSTQWAIKSRSCNALERYNTRTWYSSIYIIIGDECLCKQIASSLISPPSPPLLTLSSSVSCVLIITNACHHHHHVMCLLSWSNSLLIAPLGAC